MASSLTSFASSGLISGSGLAIAKIIGLSAIVARYSFFNAPAAETPTNTSASTRASSSVLASVAAANSSFYGVIPAALPL